MRLYFQISQLFRGDFMDHLHQKIMFPSHILKLMLSFESKFQQIKYNLPLLINMDALYEALTTNVYNCLWTYNRPIFASFSLHVYNTQHKFKVNFYWNFNIGRQKSYYTSHCYVYRGSHLCCIHHLCMHSMLNLFWPWEKLLHTCAFVLCLQFSHYANFDQIRPIRTLVFGHVCMHVCASVFEQQFLIYTCFG